MAASVSVAADQSYDVAVVGAGVVGSALAYSLARSGRTVALFERDLSTPDRIVGELLQPGGVRALKKLGLEDCLEGIDAVPVEGYQVFYGPRSVPIPYPTEAAEEQHKGVHSFSGKVEGRSFHHGSFVQALRTRAINQKGVTTFEATVKDVITEQGKVVGVSAIRKLPAPATESSATQIEENLNIRAAVTIIADGCFSKFRRTHGSSIAPTVRSNFVALELNHAPMPAPRHGHVVLSPSGPILVYQISTDHTRILIDVAGEKLPSAAKGDLQRHISDCVIPSLPEQLQPCVREELNKGQRLRSMPNSFLPPSMQGQAQAGVIVVGDAMNMRHPLTGGGMTVGLWDCVHLARVLGGDTWTPGVDEAGSGSSKAGPTHTPVDLGDWRSIRSALRSWHWQRKGLSSVINILAQALYSLFGADDENLEVLREGCFRYFEMGGECVAGPVSLLSGLAPSPLLLVYHFFSVAVYSIYSLFAHERAYPGEDRPRAPRITEWPGLAMRSILVFWTACVVILPVIWTEMKSNVPSFKEAKDASKRAIQGSGKTDASGLPSMRSIGLAVLAVSVAYMYIASDAGHASSGSPPSASNHLASGLKYFGVLPKAFASPIKE